MEEEISLTGRMEAAPVKPVERIVDLDILRGIALFGILVVNLYLFSNPIAIVVADSGPWTEWYNQAFLFLSRIFFEGKFITLFSFLFGLGFYIFTERLKMKGLPVRRVFFRRMVLLFLIGIIHSSFFWGRRYFGPIRDCRSHHNVFSLQKRQNGQSLDRTLCRYLYAVIYLANTIYHMWDLSYVG